MLYHSLLKLEDPYMSYVSFIHIVLVYRGETIFLFKFFLQNINNFEITAFVMTET